MPSECERDDEVVLAFRVGDDYYHVCDSEEDLPKLVFIIAASQCESCGSTGYSVMQVTPNHWVVVCEGNDIEGDFVPGCFMEYEIEKRRAGDVIF